MIHRTLRYPGGWEWHVALYDSSRPAEQKPLPSRKSSTKPEDVEAARTISRLSTRMEGNTPENEATDMKRRFPECADWIDDSLPRRTNHVSVENLPELGALLSGTLMIQITDDQSDMGPVHFWLTSNRLITMHEDLRVPLRLQSGVHAHKYEECSTAPEAFFIMLSALLETFHEGLDGFETRLSELEAAVRVHNRTGLLEVIIERRYELLHWSHLFIPIRELHVAAKECFSEELSKKDAFVRITHKLERIETLLKHYALEIDTLIAMDDAVSGFRGNDIMKTLTIFTVLCLPASVLGALMGSNYDKIPFKTETWGFTALITVTAVLTLIIYVWLWKKGWTGDLLNRQGNSSSAAPSTMNKADKSGKPELGSRSARHGKRAKDNGRLSGNADSDSSDSSIDQPLLRSRRNRA
ncbi:magnesium transporter CorA family protein [Paenibacillus sp. PL2-23]|uniref:magnesium transporter CorA family protein n=1 Tax=Paenibacillus sp. PL2-23 TaxID=2100729 RepID=UPI0030F664D4